MSIIESINDRSQWLDFLSYKQNNQSLTQNEEKSLWDFIENRRYEFYYTLIKEAKFPTDFPHKQGRNQEKTYSIFV